MQDLKLVLTDVTISNNVGAFTGGQLLLGIYGLQMSRVSVSQNTNPTGGVVGGFVISYNSNAVGGAPFTMDSCTFYNDSSLFKNSLSGCVPQITVVSQSVSCFLLK